MPGWVSFVVAGLLTGAVYGLMALGLSVIFGVVRVVNFAHGEMMVLAMYGVVLLHGALGFDPLAAAPVSTGGAVVVATSDNKVRSLSARDLSAVGMWTLDNPLAVQPAAIGGPTNPLSALCRSGKRRSLWRKR